VPNDAESVSRREKSVPKNERVIVSDYSEIIKFEETERKERRNGKAKKTRQ
jgi:hypothetical protein